MFFFSKLHIIQTVYSFASIIKYSLNDEQHETGTQHWPLHHLWLGDEIKLDRSLQLRSRSLDVEPHDQQCSAWLSSQTEMSNAQMLHPFLPLQFRNSSGFTLRSYQFQMATLRELGLWNTVTPDGVTGFIYDDDVGLHVLGCWVDILGTNCNHCLLITWDLSSYSVLYRDITYANFHPIFRSDSWAPYGNTIVCKAAEGELYRSPCNTPVILAWFDGQWKLPYSTAHLQIRSGRNTPVIAESNMRLHICVSTNKQHTQTVSRHTMICSWTLCKLKSNRKWTRL